MSLLGKLDSKGPVALALAVTRDSRILAAGRADGRVELWDLNERRLRRTHVHSPTGRVREVYTLAFSPGDRLIAAGTGHRLVKIWDVATGALSAQFPRRRRKSRLSSERSSS